MQQPPDRPYRKAEPVSNHGAGLLCEHGGLDIGAGWRKFHHQMFFGLALLREGGAFFAFR